MMVKFEGNIEWVAEKRNKDFQAAFGSVAGGVL
jgi:hypothetical protein